MDLIDSAYGFNPNAATNDPYGVTTVDVTGYPPLPDVSQTGPDTAPSTPTANGFGYYPADSAPSTTDLLKNALNWALTKDTQRMGGYPVGGYGQQIPYGAQYSAVVTAQQQAQARKNMQLLLLVGVGLLVLAHH